MDTNSIDPVLNHYFAGPARWTTVAIYILIYAVFLAFVPFYRKSQRKPSGAFLAFVIAFVIEMFGVPASMYVIAWIFGRFLPDGILWGHTLNQYFGLWPTNIGIALMVIAFVLVFFGWRDIHKNYWSKEEGKGELVTTGIYRYIRHPQYTGFILVTLGMLLEWATVPLLLMWPVLVWIYYRLARKEEADMEAEFGEAYREYRRQTSMFLPLHRPYHAPVAQPT